jgi:DNA-binding transcriptional LysR family regulator
VIDYSKILMYPSAHKIRSFMAVAENLSFRRASELLNLSQPALSAHVRDLEAATGVPLLMRTTRSVRLTPAGTQFLSRAKQALAELQLAVSEVKELAQLQRGRVIVACVPTVASSALPGILTTFARRFPGIQIQVMDEISERMHRRVIDREADLGIGPAERRSDEIEFTPLTRDHFIAVCSRSHDWAKRRHVRLSELTKVPFLTLKRTTNVRMVLEKAFEQAGLQVIPAYELNHHYTLGAMVSAGLGVTALPSMSLSLLGHPSVRGLKIVSPEVYRVIGVVRRRREPLSPAAEAFLDVISERISSHPR